MTICTQLSKHLFNQPLPSLIPFHPLCLAYGKKATSSICVYLCLLFRRPLILFIPSFLTTLLLLLLLWPVKELLNPTAKPRVVINPKIMH